MSRRRMMMMGAKIPFLFSLMTGIRAAYSLRKLREDYTGFAIRVRRSSDNATQDIGFNSKGDLDTSSLISFVGSGSGYINIIYSQSTFGGGLNISMSTLDNQPIIVDSGSLIEINGRPAIYFDGINDSLTRGGSAIIRQVSNISHFMVANGNMTFFVAITAADRVHTQINSLNTSLSLNQRRLSADSFASLSYTNTNENTRVSAYIATFPEGAIYENGVQVAYNPTLTSSGNTADIDSAGQGLGRTAASGFREGYFQEYVLSIDDMNSFVSKIHKNQKRYYKL
jgi:hypothetical protein